jgi:hypothetical protein
MPPAPMAALEASGPHQPGDPFAAHVDVQAQAQLGVHARGAIGAAAAGMIWRICSVSARSASVRTEAGRELQAY